MVDGLERRHPLSFVAVSAVLGRRRERQDKALQAGRKGCACVRRMQVRACLPKAIYTFTCSKKRCCYFQSFEWGMQEGVSYNETSTKFTGRKAVKKFRSRYFYRMCQSSSILLQFLQLYIFQLTIINQGLTIQLYNITNSNLTIISTCVYYYIFIHKKLLGTYYCQ